MKPPQIDLAAIEAELRASAPSGPPWSSLWVGSDLMLALVAAVRAADAYEKAVPVVSDAEAPAHSALVAALKPFRAQEGP